MSVPTLYLKATPDNTGDLVLLCGDPARVELFASHFPGFQMISRNREYWIATGEARNKRVSVISAGIGGPSNAIALEELKQIGVQAVVRIGTMMGISAPMGSLVIPHAAIREEGTSARYLPLTFPAVPQPELQRCLVESGLRAGLDVRVGLSITFDAFYVDLAPQLIGRPGEVDWQHYRQMGVLSTDMETALIFSAGQALGLPTAAICLVTVLQGEPVQFMHPEQRSQLELSLLHTALDGLIDFAER
jgi:uridine phosphorylase